MTATPIQTTIAQALVACVLILLHKVIGVEFTVPEVAVLQGGFGGALALVLPPLAQPTTEEV